ncbi:MAG: FAD-dependent oxidoreductase [Intestinibacter bartlettii]|uniref:FAD-dependent oxidoreductase n=1 Tax=Intestinibacter bartlettii TaxID=261299 RepID=UPI0026ECC7EA|nr:FAD-dependent oxidoreductase [Intestinibacter bartlettii]MDO5010085.1 FAD-dependent oxidoreductase [Intestinibacter bartlettii]
MENSFWILTSQGASYPTLDKDIDTDCLIVGAGLTGLHTAYMLSDIGKKIVVLESDKVGYGSSGRNTGKITSSHGLIYDSISKKYGDEKSRLYYEANEDGLKLIKNIIKKNNIDCNFEELPNYIFTENDDDLNKIKEEYKTCQKLEIPYEYLNNIENFPLSVKGALKLDNQAQFNTKKYMDGLAKVISSKGIEIYENTPVVGLEKKNNEYIVKTKYNNEIKAKMVIIASSNIWHDELGLYFSKEQAYRSYLTVSKLNKPIAKGMFINVEQPSKTVRTYTDKDKNYLVCGGFDHKTGKCDDESNIFNDIVEFAKNNFKIGTLEYRWSTQDYITTDNIPYIGHINKEQENLYIATGFCKWGISTSAVAAIIFKDLITTGNSKYKELFNPSRTGSYLNLKYLKENTIMAYDYIKGKIKKGSTEFDIQKEEGKIIVIDGDKYGAYRDKDGKLYVVDITCTHLGCELKFNSFEKSWDCPCHGSRFSYDGSILNGPALKPLKLLGMGDNDIDPDLV